MSAKEWVLLTSLLLISPSCATLDKAMEIVKHAPYVGTPAHIIYQQNAKLSRKQDPIGYASSRLDVPRNQVQQIGDYSIARKSFQDIRTIAALYAGAIKIRFHENNVFEKKNPYFKKKLDKAHYELACTKADTDKNMVVTPYEASNYLDSLINAERNKQHQSKMFPKDLFKYVRKDNSKKNRVFYFNQHSSYLANENHPQEKVKELFTSWSQEYQDRTPKKMEVTDINGNEFNSIPSKIYIKVQ